MLNTQRGEDGFPSTFCWQKVLQPVMLSSVLFYNIHLYGWVLLNMTSIRSQTEQKILQAASSSVITMTITTYFVFGVEIRNWINYCSKRNQLNIEPVNNPGYFLRYYREVDDWWIYHMLTWIPVRCCEHYCIKVNICPATMYTRPWS